MRLRTVGDAGCSNATYGNGLNEFEYLTLSDDACRQGALRFLDDKGEVIRGKATDAVPRLVDLETITAIARAYEQGKEISPEDLQALAGAGGCVDTSSITYVMQLLRVAAI
jgi:hypothetical protein